VTVWVAFKIDKSTRDTLTDIEKIVNRIHITQTAEVPPQERETLVRLIEDAEKAGYQRGTMSRALSGKRRIDFAA